VHFWLILGNYMMFIIYNLICSSRSIIYKLLLPLLLFGCVWNVMAHAQKPDFVFRRNGRVHLNRRGRQFSRLLAPELCASAVVMLDTPRSELVWEYWLPSPFASFPFTSPPVLHRVPSGFKRTLPMFSLFVWRRTYECRNSLYKVIEIEVFLFTPNLEVS